MMNCVICLINSQNFRWWNKMTITSIEKTILPDLYDDTKAFANYMMMNNFVSCYAVVYDNINNVYICNFHKEELPAEFGKPSIRDAGF